MTFEYMNPKNNMNQKEIDNYAIEYFKTLGLKIGDNVLYSKRNGKIIDISGWQTLDDRHAIIKYGISPYALIKYDKPLIINDHVFIEEKAYGDNINKIEKAGAI
jgi:hypothetical protein